MRCLQRSEIAVPVNDPPVAAAAMASRRCIFSEPDRAPAPTSMRIAGADTPAWTTNAHAKGTARPYCTRRSGIAMFRSRLPAPAERFVEPNDGQQLVPLEADQA